MEKKHFFAFVIVLLLISTFLFIRENYLQAENTRRLEKITREQTEIMSQFGYQTANTKAEVDILDDEIPLGAPSSKADPKYEEVLRNCMSRMFTVAPVLADEFESEAANQTDSQTLQQIFIEKTKQLSEISSEAMAKMNEIHAKEDPENTEAYQNWIHKLLTIYEQEVERIAKTYRTAIK